MTYQLISKCGVLTRTAYQIQCDIIAVHSAPVFDPVLLQSLQDDLATIVGWDTSYEDDNSELFGWDPTDSH